MEPTHKRMILTTLAASILIGLAPGAQAGQLEDGVQKQVDNATSYPGELIDDQARHLDSELERARRDADDLASRAGAVPGQVQSLAEWARDSADPAVDQSIREVQTALTGVCRVAASFLKDTACADLTE